MCLLNVYLDREDGKRLVTEEVALVIREENKMKMRSLEPTDVVTLENVYMSLIDTLNSVMVPKPKT